MTQEPRRAGSVPGDLPHSPIDTKPMSDSHPQPSPFTWIGSNRTLARRVGRPVREFLAIEAASGLLLILSTVVALVWVNSPWSSSYHDLFETHIKFQIGTILTLDLPFEMWINDALMALFFFVVGLEIKRELVAGELKDPRAAALPAMAALGGMVFPALIYVGFNLGGATHGWGIPMATDIAFAIGVVSLLGSKVPGTMKVFLLTLAIVDDIGAIVVIAVFYTSDLSLGWLAIAGVLVAVVVVMRAARVWYIPAYIFVGLFVWLAVFESGVHATIAGVVLGLLTPALPLKPDVPQDQDFVGQVMSGHASAPVVRRASFDLFEQVSVAERLADFLHPFTSFIIIPMFALSNAGIEISGDALADAARSDVTLGVVAGLVVGKLVGISLFTWIGVKSGMSRMPRGASWTHVIGLAAIGGVGFTVSLFVAGLAFDNPVFTDDAKIGIVVASMVAALVGSVILARAKEVTEVDFKAPSPN